MNTIQIPNLFSNPSLSYTDWYDLKVNERNNLNFIAINTKIYKWSELVCNYNDMRNVDLGLNYNLIFSHIFKTAGTTFSKIISNNYRIGTIQQANGPIIDNNIYSLFKLGKCMRVLIGHYELNDIIYQFIDRKKLIHLTLIRNPIERVISYYDHIISRKNHIMHSKVRTLSLHEFLKSGIIKDIHNGQTLRILGLIKGTSSTSDKSDYNLYKECRNMIEKNYSLVGTTCKFDSFLLMCNKLLGWNNIFYTPLNKSIKKTNVNTLDDEVIEIIKENNKADFLLYNYVLELNKKRETLLNITHDSIIKFQNLNKKNNELIFQLQSI